MNTSGVIYVDPVLHVNPVMRGSIYFSIGRQDADLINDQLKTHGYKLSVLPTYVGLEAIEMVE